jgi:hypothetical protein
MPNNNEYEIARWEYEGGATGVQESRKEEPVPTNTPSAPHFGLRSGANVQADRERLPTPSHLDKRLHLNW